MIKFNVAFPSVGKDANDMLRAGKLDDEGINESLWFGKFFGARSPKEKALLLYAKNRCSEGVFDCFGKTFHYKIKANPAVVSDALANAITAKAEETEFKIKGEVTAEKIIKQRNDYLNSLWLIDTPEDVYEQALSLGDKFECKQIANFTIKLFHTIINSTTKVVTYLFMVTQDGKKYQVKLTSSATKTNTAFKEGIGRYVPSVAVFSGTTAQLDMLMTKMSESKPGHVQAVDFVGYDLETEVYYYADHYYYKDKFGKIDESGIAEYAPGKFITSTQTKPIKFEYNAEFDTSWFKLFNDVFGIKGLIALAWTSGSLLHRKILNLDQSFPWLAIFGLISGTGKSTLVKTLWRCLGRDGYVGQQISQDSDAAFSRMLSQLSGMFYSALESNKSSDRRKPFDWESTLEWFSGGVCASRAVCNDGNETIDRDFQSALLICQNPEVQGGENVQTRILGLHVDDTHHVPGESKKWAKNLEKIDTKTLSGFRHAILTNESKYLAAYEREFEIIEARFEDSLKDVTIHPRVIKNHAQIAALFTAIIFDLFPACTKALCEEVNQYLLELCLSHQERVETEHHLVYKFWLAYEYLLSMKHPVNKAAGKRAASLEGKIAVRLDQFIPAASARGFSFPDPQELANALKSSKSPKFITANHQVDCQGTNRKCILFEMTDDDNKLSKLEKFIPILAKVRSGKKKYTEEELDAEVDATGMTLRECLELDNEFFGMN